MSEESPALQREIESIRFADRLHWKRGKDWSHQANAEYDYRQNRLLRLQEIRSELAGHTPAVKR